MDINSECVGCPWEMGFVDGEGDVAADDGLGEEQAEFGSTAWRRLVVPGWMR